MLKVGITGGIGSGKSVVSGLFALLNVPVFDSDKQARELIDTDLSIRSQLIKAFGEDVYLPDGQGLDRQKVAHRVFQDKTALDTLNAITHPPVIQAAKDWTAAKEVQVESNSNASFCYVIKEAALLFEAGTHASLDFILGVYTDRQTRIQRIIRRDKLDPVQVENRMARQMDEEKKMDRCDGVILNSDEALIWPQVLAWHRYFQQEAKKQS